MPRGRPRKIAAVEPERLPAEDSQPSQKVIKHKTEWVEVVEDASEEIGEEFEDTGIEDKPRKRTKNAIQEMRKKLRAQGVTPTSNLRLYIERYVHSETDAGGSWAETEFCTKYSTTEEHIFNKDYIDAARKWGPGKYRITIRMDNRIVDAFDERISATPAGPVIQHVNPNDPTSPQVIYQSVNGDGQAQQVPMSIKDIMKTQREALKEQLEMAKLMREAYGFAPEQTQQQQQTTDPELAALQLITKNPDVMEKIAGGLAKTIFGGKGVADDTPWWADILKDSITTGQLAPTVQGVVRALFPNGLFGGLFPGGQNNGQTQMATTPLAQSSESENPPHQNGQVDQFRQSLPAQGQSQGASSVVENGSDATPRQQTMTTEEQALALVIDHCRRNVPAKIAFDRLINYADAINDQAPHLSIDGYIDLLGAMNTDQVIEFVKTLPNGEQIAALSHAKEWCAELQRLIKESQESES